MQKLIQKQNRRYCSPTRITQVAIISKALSSPSCRNILKGNNFHLRRIRMPSWSSWRRERKTFPYSSRSFFRWRPLDFEPGLGWGCRCHVTWNGRGACKALIISHWGSCNAVSAISLRLNAEHASWVLISTPDTTTLWAWWPCLGTSRWCFWRWNVRGWSSWLLAKRGRSFVMVMVLERRITFEDFSYWHGPACCTLHRWVIIVIHSAVAIPWPSSHPPL